MDGRLAKGQSTREHLEATGHILLAALNELALLIAMSRDKRQAECEALAALDLLFRRLLRR
jgi:hypothetical protein